MKRLGDALTFACIVVIVLVMLIWLYSVRVGAM